jgi:hypothetical protein
MRAVRVQPDRAKHVSKSPAREGRIGGGRGTYSDLEINKFLSEGTHLIVEAESVFARLASCEDKVALSLLLSIHDDLLIGTHNLVIDIERSSRLDLEFGSISIRGKGIPGNHGRTAK